MAIKYLSSLQVSGGVTASTTIKAAGGLITLTTSGAPTASLEDGAIAVDTTNNRIYFRSGGNWILPFDATAQQIANDTRYARLGAANAFTVGGHTITNASDVVGLAVQAVAGQTANIQEWKNSAGTNVAYVRFDGLLFAGGSGILINSGSSIRPSSGAGGRITLTNSSAAVIDTTSPTIQPLVVKGAASQTANLQEWQSDSGSVLASISGTGVISTVRQISVSTNNAGIVPLFSRGASNQTADLLQQQTSAGAILGGSNALAQTFTGSTAPITVGTGGATTAASGTGTTATLTTTSNHGLAVGDLITVAGVTPTGYNGTYLVTAVPAANQVSYANTTTGSQTVAGTISVPAQASITSRSTGTVGLVVRTAGSQVSNLQEWQSSSGGVVASMGGGGSFYIGSTMGVASQPFGSTRLSVSIATAGIVGVAIRGASNQTGDAQQIQTSAGTVLGGRNALAQIYSGSTSPITVSTGGATTAASGDGTTATITTTSAHGLAVGDLVTVAGVTPTGYNGTFLVTAVGTNTVSYANTTTGSQTVAGTVSAPAQASITMRSAGTPGLEIRGATNQVANLTTWRDGNGTTVASVTTGGVYATSVQNTSTGSNSRIQLLSTGTVIDSNVSGNITLTVQNRNALSTADIEQFKSTAGTVTGGRNVNAQMYSGTTTPLTVTTGGATTAATGDGTTATITTTSAHGLAVGDLVTVAGVTPSGYNGTFLITAVPSSTQLSYANATTGAQTVAGTVATPAQTSVLSRSAGTVGLVVRAASSQVANIMQIQTAGGSAALSVLGTGGVSLTNLYASAVYNSNTDALLNLANTGIQIRNSTAGNVVLTIQNTAGTPTANLTEWKDSAGTTVVGSMSTNGTFYATALQIPSASNISNSVNSAQGILKFSTSGVEVRTATAANIALTIQNTATTPTGNLTEWKNTAGTVIASVSSAGNLTVGAVGTSTATTLYGAGNAFRVLAQNDGSVWFTINNGNISFNEQGGQTFVAGAFDFGARLNVSSLTATVIPVGIRGVANQTADLLRVQVSGGTTVAGHNALGQTYTGSTSPLTLSTGGATTAASGDGTTATITTTNAHGLAVGDLVTVAGVTPTGYNGTFLVTAVGTNTISYANTTTGAQTVAGTVSAPAQVSITARSAGTAGLAIRSQANAQVVLTEWQNSTGNRVASMDSSGNIRVANIFNLSSFQNSTITPATTGTQIVTSVASNVVLTVQNVATTPTGNLTEWKNTGGTVVASVSASGDILGKAVQTNNNYIIASEANSGGQIRFTKETTAASNPGTDRGTIYFRDGTNAGTLKLVVRSGTAGAETTVLDNIDQTVGVANPYFLTAPSASSQALIIRGAASQATNLQEWQNSSGTILARITAGGDFSLAGGSGNVYASFFSDQFVESTITLNQGVRVSSTVATFVPLTVRNTATSPTADLQRLSSSGGSTLAGFNALGQTFTGSTAPITVATGGAVSGTSSGTTATLTTATAHGLAVGDLVTIAGMTPSGYNGTWLVVTAPTSTTFTVTTTGSNLGASTVSGTVSVPAQASITARSAGTVGLVVKGGGSTKPVQQWLDASNNVLAYVQQGTGLVVGTSGFWCTNIYNAADNANSTIVMATTGTQVKSAVAANVALTVQNTHATPTGNLTEWRGTGSPGTLLASMSASGAFSAVTKSFVIDHPTKPGMRLHHGSLEGPENGVYVRGRSTGVIELPDYWLGLVHEDSITVQLTAIGKPQKLYVKEIRDNKVYVGGARGEFFYFVQAERKDVDRLEVEYAD